MPERKAGPPGSRCRRPTHSICRTHPLLPSEQHAPLHGGPRPGWVERGSSASSAPAKGRVFLPWEECNSFYESSVRVACDPHTRGVRWKRALQVRAAAGPEALTLGPRLGSPRQLGPTLRSAHRPGGPENKVGDGGDCHENLQAVPSTRPSETAGPTVFQVSEPPLLPAGAQAQDAGTPVTGLESEFRASTSLPRPGRRPRGGGGSAGPLPAGTRERARARTHSRARAKRARACA